MNKRQAKKNRKKNTLYYAMKKHAKKYGYKIKVFKMPKQKESEPINE